MPDFDENDTQGASYWLQKYNELAFEKKKSDEALQKIIQSLREEIQELKGEDTPMKAFYKWFSF